MSPDIDEVIREVRIAATPTDVFPYFTDPEKLVAWKAASAELDARPGGRFRMDVTGRGDVAQGEYLDIEPPHRIRFTWQWERDGPGTPLETPAPSVVEVTLTPDGDGTLLRLVHRGIPGPNRDASAAGWTHYLERLVLAASGEEPGPDPWAETDADKSEAAKMKETTVDTQRNKATLQRLYDEVMNGHDVDAADALITLDRPDHDPTFPPELTIGREGFKRLFGMLIAAFPDLHFTTQFMVAEDDMVTAFTTDRGNASR